ncbi:ester cyclase [Halodurantibacterium flavum]|uniref:Ester cyclase n=1 Tax=Halodurantibacterium flavum TaxID=1382802 RepID=A0ABW4S7N5_9RHOB
MTRDETTEAYRAYIACLNRQDWATLHQHVADGVRYNGSVIGLQGYKDMLVEDFRAIPDLSFNIATLICDPPMIASRLIFDCTPVGELFGLPVNGARVRFQENVFYEYQDGKIVSVWSVIDKSAVAAQTRGVT